MSEVVLPVDEVQALLDDLSPACQIQGGHSTCASAAEWVAWLVCSCGRAGNFGILLCSPHHMMGLTSGFDSSLSRSHGGHSSKITRSERIRSKSRT